MVMQNSVFVMQWKITLGLKSHLWLPDEKKFSFENKNLFSKEVNGAGGERIDRREQP